MADAEDYLEMIHGEPFLNRMLASYERTAEYVRGMNVLDYGCGYGWGSYLMAVVCRKVTGYDPDKSRISFARGMFGRQNIRFCWGEEELLEQSFDMICLFMVLPQVKEPGELLERLSGYVRMGGILYISYKSGNRMLEAILEQWSKDRGFCLLSRDEMYLSEIENLVECSYCKDRDEEGCYAL